MNVLKNAVDSIFNALNGKMTSEEAAQVAWQLGNLVVNYYYEYIQKYIHKTYFYEPDTGFVATQISQAASDDCIDTTLEMRAEDRAAGRDIAKYIAEIYFNNPEEAKDFLDKINAYIELSENMDKGYGFWGKEGPINQPEPDQFELWLEKKGYLKEYRKKKETRKKHEVYEYFREIDEEYIDECIAYGEEIGGYDYKMPEEALSWEEMKEINCSKNSMLSEEFKAWYGAFDANVSLVQNIIDNAMKITDFSSNEKWNFIINLLNPAMKNEA
jgi:hypothetical protein